MSHLVHPEHGEVHVSAASDGVVAEWLVHAGDPVDRGNPLARPHPEVPA